MMRSEPDSRRSWVVAAACFFVQALTFGLTEASGLLFVVVIKRFCTTRETASIPFTLAYCIRSAMGPVCGYFGRKFGVRIVTLYGAILSSIAIGACFFAENIVALIVLWGVLFGLSFGVETSFLNLIINQHFIKHRVKANGLIISGASVGTLILTPVIKTSVEFYGLSGTFLIISALMLNSIPASIIMILIKPVKEEIFETNPPPEKDNCSQSLTLSYQSNEKPPSGFDSSIRPDDDACKKVYASDETKWKEFYEIPLDPLTLKDGNKNIHCRHIPETLAVTKNWCKRMFPSVPSDVVDKKSATTKSVSFQYTPSADNDPLYTKRPTLQLSCIDLYQKPSTGTDTASESVTLSADESQSKWHIVRLMCDPTYIVLLIGSGLYYFSITCFLTIIVDHGTDIGVSMTNSTYILMWIAASDIIGYICLGWVFDFGYLSLSKLSSICFCVVSLASAALVWSTSYAMLLGLITCFEFGQCGVIILCSPLVAELIAEDLQPTAIASVSILSAPIALTITPLIGFFRDGGGSYAGVFYVISGCMMLCSILFLCIPKLGKQISKTECKD